MCTLCQALDPKLKNYDSHVVGDPDVSRIDATLQMDAQTMDANGLPYYSYGQIATYLTDGYWVDTGRSARSFDVSTGDTLTVDLSGLDARGTKYATIALEAWTAASGLKFRDISAQSAENLGPTAIVHEEGDAGSTAGTAARIAVGERFKGKIDAAGGTDWIAVTLTAGQSYAISLSGDGSAGQLEDTFLRLIGGAGKVIATNDDRAAGDRSSAIDFTPTATATYYIEASGYGTNTGTYKLDVQKGVSNAPAHIVFDDNNSGAYASASVWGGTIFSASINIDDGWSRSNNAYFLQTYIHEIGHALGLGHAGNYNGAGRFPSDAVYANDSWQASVMSYFDQRDNTNISATRSFVASAQMADIIAVQNLYGTPTGIHSGNSIYGEGQNTGQFGMDFASGFAVTIHDTGGIDLINLAQSTANQTIDLNGGTFSDINGRLGNIGIATGTVIENATTGSGNDHVTGNAANNVITTGPGNDNLYGMGGNDILKPGTGTNFVYGGAGNDTAAYGRDMQNFRVIYDAKTVHDGLLKIQNTAGDITQIKGVETLAFGDGSYDVSQLVADLKAAYGGIAAASKASYTVNLATLSSPTASSTPVPFDPATSTPPAKMEIGSARILQQDDAYWQKVSFSETIENAAVVMGPASSEGGHPLSIRVRNVTDTGFEFQVDEWDYLDGYHVELSVSWMAGSLGSHSMADGTRVTFGKQDVTSTNTKAVGLTGFVDKPLVFAQLTGDSEKVALTHRLDGVTKNGFSFELQAQESTRDGFTSIAEEDLFWAAMDIANDSFFFEHGTVETGSDYATLGTQLNSKEAFLADMQTLNGGDTAALRYDLGANGQVSLRVEEETSADEETFHIIETAAWFTAEHGVFELV